MQLFKDLQIFYPIGNILLLFQYIDELLISRYFFGINFLNFILLIKGPIEVEIELLEPEPERNEGRREIRNGRIYRNRRGRGRGRGRTGRVQIDAERGLLLRAAEGIFKNIISVNNMKIRFTKSILNELYTALISNKHFLIKNYN